MTSTKYPTLQRAGLTQSYLHTNSTTHQFLFGAVAELLDNARDADATKINIFTTKDPKVRGGFYLNFLDNGKGMDPTEVNNIVQFGKSFKRARSDNMIGQYGNGLKSGSMRIGNDFILFTKKDDRMSALMLSRTFHDKEQIESIICPMPIWLADTTAPVYQEGGRERHKQEIDLMCKYSPFKTETELLEQFKKLKNEKSGTLIVIYNIKLLDSGEPELDIMSDRTDIRMAEMDPEDQSNLPERVSFKAYAAILYLDPHMRIYVQNKKIRTKRLASTLCDPMLYKFTSNRFKKRSEDEVEKAEQQYLLAVDRAKEAESQARDLEKKLSNHNPKREEKAQLRKLQDKAVEARQKADFLKSASDHKRKSLKSRKSLDFVFGFNINNRKYYGMFIYNCSRLIRMYERVGPQLSGDQCAGIIGVVNVPYLVLEPTHNKQHFADNKEYRHMLKSMGDHLQCYRKDAKEVTKRGGIKKFWQSFGYLSEDWTDSPSSEPKYVRARAMKIPKVIQCDSCLKWRTLAFTNSHVGKELPEGWTCKMNTMDAKHNQCHHPEEKMKIPEGFFRKETKTKEQRQAELTEKMEKMQRELNKVQSLPEESQKRSERIRRPKIFDSDIDDDEDDGIFSKKARWKTSSHDGKSRKSHDSERRSFKKESSKRVARDISPDSPPPREKRSRKARKDVVVIDDDDTPPRRKRMASMESLDFDRSDHMDFSCVKSEAESSDDDVPIRQIKKKMHEKAASSSSAPDDNKSATSKSTPATDVMIGKKVEVVYKDRWRPARVVGTDCDDEGHIKSYTFKFDQLPKDQFDQTLPAGSDQFRFLSDDDVQLNGAVTSSKPNIAATASSSSANQQNGMSSQEKKNYENILTKLKTCLRYFLPPNWRISKDDIQGLDLAEIVNFPMDEFFDHYESGLRCLVSNFKQQADQQRQNADDVKQELHEAQQVIYDLLYSHDQTPQMSFEEVVPYARAYVENMANKNASTNNENEEPQ